MRYITILFFISVSLFAHKLYILADDDGKTLHIKSYFTKSSFCQDCKVKILGEKDKLLFEGITDKKGEASFPHIQKNIDIEVIASMGHKNRVSYESENNVSVNNISENVDENESYTKMILALLSIGFIFFLLKLVKKR